MSRRKSIRSASALIFVAIATAGGCTSTSARPGEHASTSILDSGPQPKVTSLQAADIQLALGRSFEEEGKTDQAKAAYLAALRNDPKRGDIELRLAILDELKGDRSGADQHFANALKLRPTDPEVLCDLGYSLYLRRRWSDAEATLQKALALDHTHLRSHANLALVMAHNAEGKALDEFAKAGCDPADAGANLGLIYALEGDLEESKRQYALALRFKPNSALAKEGLKAATVALQDRADPPVIASVGEDATTRRDPNLMRASTTQVDSPVQKTPDE